MSRRWRYDLGRNAVYVSAHRTASFDAPFDRMSELLLDKDNPLLESEARSHTQEMAFTRTITALRRLDRNKRDRVFDFLRDARLLGVKLPALGETRAEIEIDPVSISRERRLTELDLPKAGLYEADLSGAWLDEANLSEASLSGANLHEAFLPDAILNGASLWGVGRT